MELLDCRRLTGPNLLWDRPSVVADIACAANQADAVQTAWTNAVRQLHRDLGWAEPQFCAKTRIGGLSIAFDGPIDRLYAGIALAELAWSHCRDSSPSADDVSLIKQRADEEANPALILLAECADKKNAPFLWDDDEVSVGYGASARIWPARSLPAPEEIDWSAARRLPIGLITGTNGKTTTARMCARILQHAGHSVGLTSTEGIWINDREVDDGDYAGPGGARAVLRQHEVTAAVLETARGGLLRRGLGTDQADVALITNIAADHLGDFGSRSLNELLEIKWIISRAVRDQGMLILNADDARLVAHARQHIGPLTWFSLNPDNPTAQFRPDGGWLIRERNQHTHRLCRINDIPLTLNGAARHNVANALAAAALCSSLGAKDSAIAAGLTSMRPDDNPGRGNLYELGGVRIMVDFAHNPQAISMLAELASALPAKRRLLAFSQAGDRTDALLRECADCAWTMRPDHVVISELSKYARGRSPKEIFAILRDKLVQCGCPASEIIHVDEELEALKHALQWAEDGDLLIMLILSDASAVREHLERIGAKISSPHPS
jgi:UDP-N-acetylmuramyl tripeptide synthase